jgi:hypothetical protein
MSRSRTKTPKNPTNIAARKVARAAAAPRPKRTLTRVQKLREHIMLELGIDKLDIARAIGTTPQTVSNLFLDENRSAVFEPKVVEYLRTRYIEESDAESMYMIDAIIAREYKGGDWSGIAGCPITGETLGWPKRVITVEPYPIETARAAAALRPDLSSGDAISAVLTTDPTLTAEQVIEILDTAAEDAERDRAHDERTP